MSIRTLTLNHHRAPLALRERVAVPAADLPDRLASLQALSGVDEALLLSTCNRTEVTVVGTPTEQALVDWLASGAEQAPAALQDAVEWHQGETAVRHLFRVAAGLDSMVLGEPQILGQVKQATDQAREADTLGPTLDRLTQAAFAAAKAVRSDTGIGNNPVSFAYAGIRLAERIFDKLAEQSALLIGAGEMIDLFATHLRSQGVKQLHFANRTTARAETLAHRHHGASLPFDAITDYLHDFDIVVSCTAAPTPILHAAPFKAALRSRKRKPICVLDMAVPRDIAADVEGLSDVYLYSVDDLRGIIEQNQQARRMAAESAETLLDHHVQRFVHWLDTRSAGRTIRALRRQAHAEAAPRVARAAAALARGEAPEAVLQSLSRSLTNKMLHTPTSTLRRAPVEDQAALLAATRRLFKLDSE